MLLGNRRNRDAGFKQEPDMDQFEKLRYEAFNRGLADFERGVPRRANPHKNNAATDEAEHWFSG
jgi:hypothetical protein